MESPYYTDQEKQEAEEHLPRALEAIRRGDLFRAETILDAIVANVPADYRYSFDGEDGALMVKFWDQEEFVYYVTQNQPDRAIYWLANAYGRAYFYRGFLCIANKKPFEALQWLDNGLALEPDKPLFYIEKAKAFDMLKQPEAAMEEYEAVLARGEALHPTPHGAALRGKGFHLIELGRLDEAERIFQESLRIAPDNEIALGELAYIKHLRDGGARGSSEVVAGRPNIERKCYVCGAVVEKGTVFNSDGQLIFLCESCNGALEAATQKKWWQFWRR